MHREILTKDQAKLLPLVKEFKRGFYLVGGTAIALHLGHRRSIDFDLFTKNAIPTAKIMRTLRAARVPYQVIFQDDEQIHLTMLGVKVTFFNYEYDVPHAVSFEDIITMPTLLDLAAMKAFALGKRAKWKDYVDLYFILKNHYSLDVIAVRAKEYFGGFFSKKLFRQQLCYFNDVKYTEELEYINRVIPDNEIKEFLSQVATAPF